MPTVTNQNNSSYFPVDLAPIRIQIGAKCIGKSMSALKNVQNKNNTISAY